MVVIYRKLDEWKLNEIFTADAQRKTVFIVGSPQAWQTILKLCALCVSVVNSF